MIAALDKKFIWHPLTQHQTALLATPIMRGEGAYLIDEKGNKILDLISSWWVNLHGHAHPKIAEAIYEQALKLEQVIFADFTHAPAVHLATELLKILPDQMQKVFYSDNGSTAIEVSLKMAYQYWRNQGKKEKSKFICFKGGYHGDTLGAMSLGQASGFFSQFKNLLFEIKAFDYPATWLNDDHIEEKEKNILSLTENYLVEFSNEVAAVMIEPLVQGSSGMNMCRPLFLQQLEKLAKAYDVLVIYDEVMTGFGRTGENFACIKANTTPDIICLSKGLTGGFLPLSATVAQEKIYEAFLSEHFEKALAHSHSFTANPLGCAAAIASLKLLSESKQKIKQIENIHQTMLSELKTVKEIQYLRYTGTIAAFNLKKPAAYGSANSVKLRKHFEKIGLLIRPLGNTIYFMPPYCILENDLKNAYETVMNELQGITA